MQLWQLLAECTCSTVISSWAPASLQAQQGQGQAQHASEGLRQQLARSPALGQRQGERELRQQPLHHRHCYRNRCVYEQTNRNRNRCPTCFSDLGKIRKHERMKGKWVNHIAVSSGCRSSAPIRTPYVTICLSALALHLLPLYDRHDKSFKVPAV